jgi:hypothetical protein
MAVLRLRGAEATHLFGPDFTSHDASLYQDKVGVGKEVDLFIRPEEVMIIREGKPVKDSLKQKTILSVGFLCDRRS